MGLGSEESLIPKATRNLSASSGDFPLRSQEWHTFFELILLALFATAMAVVLMTPLSLLFLAQEKATSSHQVTALSLLALLATTARTRSVSPVPLFVSPALALLLLSAWLALVIVI